MTKTPVTKKRTSVLDFLSLVRWLDGTPVLDHIEDYRKQILSTFLDTYTSDGRVQYTLGVAGRGKKNFKSCDLVLASLFALLGNDSVFGNDVIIVASDLGQAQDDLSLLKKLVQVSPHLNHRLRIMDKAIVRKDDKGTIKVIPGGDISGSHGKTARLVAIDELHTAKDWKLLEALALDPLRPDAQQFITSYASLYTKPGAPLHDLVKIGQAGTDKKLLFSWYAADYCTDPSFMERDPEHRANPSIASFDIDYLPTQKLRLPSHVFRRLHLNLGGQPDGAALNAEMIMEAITRGVRVRLPEGGVSYTGFIDMSGGSRDDACLAISYLDADGRAILARLVDQGQRPPFDPRAAVSRFVPVLREYGIHTIVGDAFAGQTFLHDFLRHGIQYEVSAIPASKLYESIEPYFNARECVLLDHPELESQLLGLIWKGNKITHESSEHDDFANAAVGALLLALQGGLDDTEVTDEELQQVRLIFARPGRDVFDGIPAEDFAGNLWRDPNEVAPDWE
jgi:hypothetical protein